jgi:glycosyltransferase involved in cell wall biosynthesis
VSVALTVVVCSYNPRDEYLSKTLEALANQEPFFDNAWELLIVDNASNPALSSRVDLSWHPRARIIREECLGLTYARLRGFRESTGEVIVFVDDDNVLNPDYLRIALSTMTSDPTLGAAGGKAIPRYELAPPDWFGELGLDLGCRDLGEAAQFASWHGLDTSRRSYPACAPIGAGMVIRRLAFAAYVSAAENDATRTGLGRRGSDLASGEDNDMMMTLLDLGWQVAYLPQLRLEHMIPAHRVTYAYLANYAYASGRTWVLVLDIHGLRPWGALPTWTAPLRKVKAYITLGAWRSVPAFVRWRGACGRLDGQARLSSSGR